MSNSTQARGHWLDHHSLWWLIIVIILTVLAALPYECLSATRRVLYVDPNVKAGGAADGSSWTNAFSRMYDAEALELDLYSMDQTLEVFFREPTGTKPDTKSVTWNWPAGYTDATHRVCLRQDPNGYHKGSGSAGGYVLSGQVDDFSCNINMDDIEIDGLIFDGLNDSARYGAVQLLATVSRFKMHNCLLRNYNGSTRFAFRAFYGVGGYDRLVYNNIFYDNANACRWWNSQGVFANNTIVRSTRYGLDIVPGAQLNLIARNNLIIDSGTHDWLVEDYGGTLLTGCNYTSDLTSPDGSAFRNADPNWKDVDANDFRLNDDMAAYLDDCVNMGEYYVDDVNSTDSRGHWDAGAHETIYADEPPAPPVPPVPMSYYVDPTDGLDPVSGVMQVDVNLVTHDGTTRAGAWKTVTAALYRVPDSAYIYLMEGNHGDILMERPTRAGYPIRAAYVTVTRDPNAASEPVINRLYQADKDCLYFIRWLDVTFQRTDTGGAIPVYTGEYVVWMQAGHYQQFVDCNVIGVMNPAPGDPRPRVDYSVMYGLNVGVSGSGGRMSNISITGCTVRRCRSGIKCYSDGMQSPTTIAGNLVYECSANGIHTSGPLTGDLQWVTIEGNVVRNQRQCYMVDYNDMDHGTAIAPTGGHTIVNGNLIDSYGTTAGIRNYNDSVAAGRADVIVTNNVILHSPNYAMELWNLASGSKILHNTCIGSVAGDVGRHYFGYPEGYWLPAVASGNHNMGTIIVTQSSAWDVSNLQICNNILLGQNAPPPTGCIFTGNAVWAINGYSQTSLDAVWPGNTLYCPATAAQAEDDNDANSTTFTVGGDFFADTDWLDDYAFDPVPHAWTTWDVNYVYTLDGGPAPITGLDLALGSDGIDAGSASYTVTTDIHGGERDASPDRGADEYPDPDPPPVTRPKITLIRRAP